jgi:hypothetical protein
MYTDSYEPYGTFEKSIVCEHIHNSSINLQEVFVKLSSYTNSISNDDQNATYFNYFILSNASITSIPESVFVNITFRRLMLQNNFQLTTIHKNAFSYGKDYVESFETMNTSLSDSETIFSIIKQFQNLRHLSMQNDRLKSIPSYAFNHTYLTHVYFGYQSEYPKQTQPIESIGDYAFDDLPSLNYLQIHSPNLTKITKYEFALRKRFISDAYGGRGLILSIGGERLNSTSFELKHGIFSFFSLNSINRFIIFLCLFSSCTNTKFKRLRADVVIQCIHCKEKNADSFHYSKNVI